MATDRLLRVPARARGGSASRRGDAPRPLSPDQHRALRQERPSCHERGPGLAGLRAGRCARRESTRSAVPGVDSRTAPSPDDALTYGDRAPLRRPLADDRAERLTVRVHAECGELSHQVVDLLVLALAMIYRKVHRLDASACTCAVVAL